MLLTNAKIRQNILDAVERVASKGGAWRGIHAATTARTADRYRWHAADLGYAITVRPSRTKRGAYSIEIA